MTPQTARMARGGLVALVAGVALLVAVTLRSPLPQEPSPTPAPDASRGASAQMVGFTYRGFKGERESYVLKAQQYVGQEQDEAHLGGVELTFYYMSRGQRGTGTITSDACTYTPSQQRAVFRGHVVLRTADGLELTTESLVYRGDREVAKSDEHVDFRRKSLSGSSDGLLYQAGDGTLELQAHAFLRLESEKDPPMEIRSGRAIIEREEDKIRFLEGVKVTQGGDVLTAERLVLDFTWEDERVTRAQAIDKVDLRMAGGHGFPGTQGATARGPKHLTCWRLDLLFRPDRRLEQAEALNDAELTTLPGPGEPPERRRLRGQDLTFHFDEQAQLDKVTGLSGSSFEAEPLDPATGPIRTGKSRIFVARIDPATGETQRIDFKGGAEFGRGGQKATAQEAWHQGSTGTLFLRGEPQLVDEDQGSQLRAQTIDLGTVSGDVSARGTVRHVFGKPGRQGKAASRRGLLRGGDDAPTIVTSQALDYDGKTRTANYTGDALLRSGKDEVRAPEIHLEEKPDGGRRLVGAGGVVSLMNPRAESGGRPASPVQARAREMVYDEARNQIVYTGDVVIEQGDISTKSPAATLALTPDGGGIQTLVAGEPVEVHQGERTVTGTRGTFTPQSQTLVVVGESVVLKDPSQVVRGRSLTFHVGDDRILVDGQEARTEAVFRKEPPKP